MKTQMTSPRELDAKVAERVMGWKRMTWREYCTATKQHCYESLDFSNQLTSWWHSTDGNMQAEESAKQVWSPSTQHDPAMEVVKKLSSEGFIFELTNVCENGAECVGADLLWTCTFAAVEKASVCTKTLQLAICLAALKVKVKEAK